MYKDKDKQREADRARQKRRRDKIKAEGVTESGRDGQGVTVRLPEHSPDEVAVFERDMISAKPERTAQGNIRVSKPGDPDYVPQCETTRAHIEGLMQGLGCYEPRVIETQGPCSACGQDDCEEGCPRLSRHNSLNSKDLRGGLMKVDNPPKGGSG